MLFFFPLIVNVGFGFGMLLSNWTVENSCWISRLLMLINLMYLIFFTRFPIQDFHTEITLAGVWAISLVLVAGLPLRWELQAITQRAKKAA